MSQDVVLTGVGIVSPIGIGIDSYWRALLNRACGITVRPEFEQTELPFRLWAPVSDFDGRQFVKPRKAMKVMCRPIQFGYAAAQMASDHAGLPNHALDPDRVGCVFGTETFFADPLEVADVFRKCVVDSSYDHSRWGEAAMREIQPLWMLKYLPNMVASHISIAHDARGPCNSICQGESSGLLALIEGVELIRRGSADVVIVGGTGSPLSISALLCRGQDQISKEITDPKQASRPFDARRDGSVIGEGAGAVVLESAAHAEKRNATVLARVAGVSRTYSPADWNQFKTTLETCLSESLDLSGIPVEQISHVNACGTGMVEHDAAEAQAIHNVYGDVPVVAYKSNFGQLGPGSSIVELGASLMSLQQDVLAPSLNFENPDPLCPVSINREKKSCQQTAAAKVAYSLTGQIASVVVESPN